MAITRQISYMGKEKVRFCEFWRSRTELLFDIPITWESLLHGPPGTGKTFTAGKIPPILAST